jgi:hypothetical protein
MKEAVKHLERLALEQQERLRKIARSLGYDLTDDDLLQPNDYPVLENSVDFRYEEGVKEGILTAIATLRALEQEAVKVDS